MARRKKTVFIILISILALCLGIGYMRTQYREKVLDTVTVYSRNGVWDLREIDFTKTIVKLAGDVEYIEGELLTPEEFEDREEEADIGDPIDQNSARTARLLLQMPDNGDYALDTYGDYARSIYVNGEWEDMSGTPGETAETFKPGFEPLYMEVEADNGVIEIISQGGNFVHVSGSSYSNMVVGEPENLRWYLDVGDIVGGVEMGILLALFVVHFILGFIFQEYQLNIRFSLLCLVWFIRLGLTGTKLLYQVLPHIPWEVAFKLEYITIAASVILLAGIVRRQYKGILSERVFTVTNIVFYVFLVAFMVLDTYTMSRLLILVIGLYFVVVVYITIGISLWIVLNWKSAKLEIAQVATIFPLLFLFIAVVQEGLYYSELDILGLGYTMTEVAILAVAFCETIFLCYSTMEAVKEIRLKEEGSRRKAEELERFLEMKASFMGIVAHEIKTPLSIVMGGAGESLDIIEDIESYPVGRSITEELNDVKKDMDIIIKTVKNLNQTVFDLLDTTALETGRLSLTFQYVELKSFIIDVREQYSGQLDKSGNQVILDLEEDIQPIKADEKRLRQVMFNLLSNALRHTKNGEIKIKLWQEDKMVYIEVEDTGEGIKKELLGKLTKGYIDGGPHGYRGGIGIYVCQQVIESHEGTFEIQAQEGVGTSVRVGLKKEK